MYTTRDAADSSLMSPSGGVGGGADDSVDDVEDRMSDWKTVSLRALLRDLAAAAFSGFTAYLGLNDLPSSELVLERERLRRELVLLSASDSWDRLD